MRADEKTQVVMSETGCPPQNQKYMFFFWLCMFAQQNYLDTSKRIQYVSWVYGCEAFVW